MPASSADVESSDGLEAFVSEPPAAGPAGRAIEHTPRSAVWLMAGLTALVLIEAVPAALWLRSTLAPVAVRADTPPPTDPLPAGVVAAEPCEPTVAAPAAVAAMPDAPRSAVSAASAAAVAPRALAGTLAVAAPVAMRVYEESRLIGTTEADTIMLSVGTHNLEFVNEAVGYRERRTVTVQAGRTASIRLNPPLGTLHVNAVPWAEVWVNNERLGETPIGNLKMPVGSHEVVFRHPEMGERRATVLVTLIGPARISMDLRNR